MNPIMVKRSSLRILKKIAFEEAERRLATGTYDASGAVYFMRIYKLLNLIDECLVDSNSVSIETLTEYTKTKETYL